MDFRYPDKPRDSTPAVVNVFCQEDWISQAKYDGWRMLIYIGKKEVKLYSRVGSNFESLKGAKLPNGLKREILSLGYYPNTILDAEFVSPRGSHDPAVYLFDCLAFNGEWLTDCTYDRRFRFISYQEDNIKKTDHIQIATTLFPGDNKLFSTDGTDIELEYDPDKTVSPHLEFFGMLKRDWKDAGMPKDWLYEGIVVKRKSGKLTLSLNDSKKSVHMQKLKFRDIGDKRY